MTKNLLILNSMQEFIFGVPVDAAPTSLSAAAYIRERELPLSGLKLWRRKKYGFVTASTPQTNHIVTERTKRSDCYIKGLK
jgi:hypothetical protein